jgi:hypothetical protein
MIAFAEPPDPAPRLFLVTRRDSAARSLFEHIAALYRLYSYGNAGLSPLVRAEIERAALALTAVFLFDLGAWTLIWNAVFHRGEMMADRMTWIAAGMALIFACIVLSFEQGVVTTDWTRPGLKAWLKRWGTLILRLCVIVASAIATSQSVEVLVFAHDIADRVHQERVWEEIISRALQFQRLDDATRGEGEAKGYTEGRLQSQQKLESALADAALTAHQIETVRADVAKARAGLPALQRQLNDKQNAARQAKAKLDDAAARMGATPSAASSNPLIAALTREYNIADQQVRAARAAIADANNRISRGESEIARLGGDLVAKQAIGAARQQEQGERAQEWKGFQATLVQRRDALQHWIVRVANSSPEDKEIQEGDFVYRERPYSFAEQLRVLDDLYTGRPAQRRNLLSIRQDLLTGVLNLEDPNRQDQAMSGDRVARATVVRRLYVGLFVLSMFVPCMGVLFKLTMHPQLTEYYSAEWQANNGHLYAMHHMQGAADRSRYEEKFQTVGEEE